MSRAGKQLHGDWQRWNDDQDGTRTARLRALLIDLALFVAKFAIGGSALFGFG